MAAFIADIDYLFIGRVLGPRELGLYTLGFRLPEMLVLNISLVAGKVLFPAFAVVDRAELGRVVVRAFRYTMIVAVPIAAGLVGLARPIVQVVFGDQWLGSVTVMQLITGYVLAVTIGIPAGTMYKSIGRVDVLLRLAVPRLVLVTAGIALTVHRGIDSVATVQLVVAAVFSALGILIAPRFVGTTLRELGSAAWPALLGGLVILLTCAATHGLSSQPLLRLVVATAAGGAAYVGVLALTARPDLLGLLDALGLTGHGRPRLGGGKRRGGE
jgi:O-antigen/teichoic acid export membrane protein